jgi:UDP-N-acetylmuramyl pentapeptide synthase
MIIEALTSLFRPNYPATLVYMLQSTEYRPGPYLAWYWRTNNFCHVAKRRTLERTKAARLLLLALRMGMILQITAGIALVIISRTHHLEGVMEFGLATIISAPIIWAHLVVVPLLAGRWFIAMPKERKLVARAHQTFSGHKGIRIAVAGSYGKTTMKELLLTVLSEGKNVAATPANKNVTVSHARFASKLKGDEDIVIIEFGEAAPGDIMRFATTTKPDIGIITGLAPAHLDRYKTLEAAGKDIFSLADFLHDQNVYANSESPAIKTFIKPGHELYSANGVLGWKVQDISVQPAKTSFTMKKGSQTLNITSGLIGRHQVGPLALAAALADKLGLSKQQIEAGLAKSEPYEHRMQPRQMAGAWIIDDTYNGNLEGIRVGLQLLKELPAKRKIYVTPGLVDQGAENERVHREIGKLIAKANPDSVVLMKNSVTKWIEAGLKADDFKGKLTIENEPLNFYTNLEHFVAAGDVVLMQNDWTDNYN